MGLETSTTIQGLNIAWPLGTDPRSEGDNHLRLVKTVLKNVFDDSSANVLLFKVIGPRLGKATNTQQLEAMQGATVRGQLLWNVGAGVAPMARLRAYNDAGAVANTLALDDNGLAISVGTFTIPNATFSGTMTAGQANVRELQVDPTSAVTGIRILPSDTNSGRLFFETLAGTKNWSISAWDGSGAMQFATGGVYGSSTGSNRMTLYTDGQLETSGEMNAAFSVRVTRGYGTVTRGVFAVTSSGQLELNRVDTDGTTYTNRLLMGTNVASFVAAAGATSYTFRLANGSAQRRIDLFFSGTNPLALVARDATDDSVFCSLTANTSGVPFWTYGTGTSSEMISVATLNLTVYGGTSASATAYPVGSIISMFTNGVAVARNATAVPTLSGNDSIYFRLSGQPNAGTVVPGVWRSRGHVDSNWCLMQKVSD